MQATESQLREYFGTQVQIKKAKNKGKIEIEFYSEDDLYRILEILNIEEQWGASFKMPFFIICRVFIRKSSYSVCYMGMLKSEVYLNCLHLA